MKNVRLRYMKKFVSDRGIIMVILRRIKAELLHIVEFSIKGSK